MKHDTNWKVLKEKEAKMAFNMGLQSAVFVLEMTDGLSPEGRKYLIDELKKNIEQSEGVYPVQLLECISDNFE